MADEEEEEEERPNVAWRCRHCGASGLTPDPPHLCPVCGKPN